MRITPINVLMIILEILFVKRLVMTHIGLIEDEPVDKKGEVMLLIE